MYLTLLHLSQWVNWNFTIDFSGAKISHTVLEMKEAHSKLQIDALIEIWENRRKSQMLYKEELDSAKCVEDEV